MIVHGLAYFGGMSIDQSLRHSFPAMNLQEPICTPYAGRARSTRLLRIRILVSPRSLRQVTGRSIYADIAKIMAANSTEFYNFDMISAPDGSTISTLIRDFSTRSIFP
jgi:hypothetical protein